MRTLRKEINSSLTETGTANERLKLLLFFQWLSSSSSPSSPCGRPFHLTASSSSVWRLHSPPGPSASVWAEVQNSALHYSHRVTVLLNEPSGSSTLGALCFPPYFSIVNALAFLRRVHTHVDCSKWKLSHSHSSSLAIFQRCQNAQTHKSPSRH